MHIRTIFVLDYKQEHASLLQDFLRKKKITDVNLFHLIALLLICCLCHMFASFYHTRSLMRLVSSFSMTIMLSEHYRHTLALVNSCQVFFFLHKWLQRDTAAWYCSASLGRFHAVTCLCMDTRYHRCAFLYPLHWYLTCCFLIYQIPCFHAIPLWSHFVIVFPVSNVTLTHLLPSQQNPIFADTLPASASLNMFSKSHWCVFFSLSVQMKGS